MTDEPKQTTLDVTTNHRIGTTQTPTVDPIEATLTIQKNLKEPTQHGEHGNKVPDIETVPIAAFQFHCTISLFQPL